MANSSSPIRSIALIYSTNLSTSMKKYIWLIASISLVLLLGIYTEFLDKQSLSLQTESYPLIENIRVYTLLWLTVCMGGMLYQFRTKISANINQIKRELQTDIIRWETLAIEFFIVLGAMLGISSALHLMRAEIVIIALCLYSAIRYRERYTQISWLVYIIGLIPLSTAVGLLYTDHLDKGVALLNLQLILLMPLLRPYIKLPRSHIERIFSVLFHLCLAMMIYQTMIGAIYIGHYSEHVWDFITFNKCYITQLPNTAPYWPLLSWLHTHHPTGILLLFSIVGLVYSYHRIVKSRDTNPHFISYIYFLLSLWVSLLLQSRYGILASIGTLTLLSIFHIRRYLKRKWRVIVMISTIIALSVIGLASNLAEKISFFGDSLRLQVFTNAIDTWLKSPILGLGAGSDAFVHLEQLDHIHSHNVLLSILVDTGIFGGFVIIALYIGLLWESIKLRNFPVGAFTLLWIPLSWIDSVFYSSLFCYLTALFFFLLLSVDQRACHYSKSSDKSSI